MNPKKLIFAYNCVRAIINNYTNTMYNTNIYFGKDLKK